MSGTPGTPLSADEERVLELLGEGRSVEEMAATLGMSPDKMREHVQSMLDKFKFRRDLNYLGRPVGYSRQFLNRLRGGTDAPGRARRHASDLTAPPR